jgi:hypothetical protein
LTIRASRNRPHHQPTIHQNTPTTIKRLSPKRPAHSSPQYTLSSPIQHPNPLPTHQPTTRTKAPTKYPPSPITSRPVPARDTNERRKSNGGGDCTREEENDLRCPVDIRLVVDQHTQHVHVSLLTCHADWRGPVLQQNTVRFRARTSFPGATLVHEALAIGVVAGCIGDRAFT